MKLQSKIIILISILAIVIVISLSVNYVKYLNKAHSSFEEYYKFRGCVSLINKTDSYGFCKTGTGETIKIVKFNDKWYLDNDLPVNCGFFECP
jgi:hypothetical protein